MKKTALAALAAGLLGAVLLAPAPAQAAAGTPGCMTKAEWRAMKLDHTVTPARLGRVVSKRVKYYDDVTRDGDRTVYYSVRQCLASGRPAPRFSAFHNSVDVYLTNYVYSADYSTVTRVALSVDDIGSWSRPHNW